MPFQIQSYPETMTIGLLDEQLMKWTVKMVEFIVGVALCGSRRDRSLPLARFSRASPSFFALPDQTAMFASFQRNICSCAYLHSCLWVPHIHQVRVNIFPWGGVFVNFLEPHNLLHCTLKLSPYWEGMLFCMDQGVKKALDPRSGSASLFLVELLM